MNTMDKSDVDRDMIATVWKNHHNNPTKISSLITEGIHNTTRNKQEREKVPTTKTTFTNTNTTKVHNKSSSSSSQTP